MKYRLLLSDFNETWNFWTAFRKLHENPFGGCRFYLVDRRTDMTKFIVSLRSFANTTKTWWVPCCGHFIWIVNRKLNQVIQGVPEECVPGTGLCFRSSGGKVVLGKEIEIERANTDGCHNMIRLCGNTSRRAIAVILDVAAPCGGDPFSCSRCCQYTRLLSVPGVPTPPCYSPHRHKGTSSDMCILSISKLCRQQEAWLRIQSQSGAYMCAWSYFWIRIWCSFPHWGGGLKELEMKHSRKESLPYFVCIAWHVSHVSVRHPITRNTYIAEERKVCYGS